MKILKTILLSSLYINILYSGSYQQFVIPCKIPHSPSTSSVPEASKNGVYAGNCSVQGDNGKATCHTPNEKAKDQSYMKKRNQFDRYFMASQKITGVSWKILKAKAYQESSLNYGKSGIMIKTGDGVAGGGILQLSKGEVNAVLKKIKANTPWGGAITGINSETTFTNPIHHCLVGTGWIFHKMDEANARKYSNLAYSMKNSPDGWTWKTNNDNELYFKLKTFTFFNGWKKGCVVKGRPLFRYGEIINSNLEYLITGVSSTPVPYTGGGDENTTLPTLPNTTGVDPITGKPLSDPNKKGNPYLPWKPF